MRIILLIIVILVVADSAYSRETLRTAYIYQNEEVALSGKPTVMKVTQWATGARANTTVDVAIRACVAIDQRNLELSFLRQGPLNHLSVKLLVPIVQCANPQIQKFVLYSNLIPAIELADIKVDKKRIVLWVFSNQVPHGWGG